MADARMSDVQGYDEPTGWTGWIVFAATMMIIAGSLNMLYGLIAVVNDTWVGWNSQTANAVVLDISQWGWVQLILGLVLLLSGIGVLSGNILARTVGVFVAGLNLIGNFMFIPVYPIWTLTVIVLDVLVIWALTAHGREMRGG
jgi:hypothetical protein